MTIELRVAQNNDKEEWDSMVSQSSQGTLFHQWEWLKIVERNSGSRLYPLIGMNKGSPIGLIPLFLQKIGPLKMVFSPPPHVVIFYLGPIFLKTDSLKQEKIESQYLEFQKQFEDFINTDLHAQYTFISLPPALHDPRPFKWSGYHIQLNFDYSTDLSIGADSLFSSLDKRQRQDIKRAKERNMTFEIGGENEYKYILDLMDLRYAQQGKIVKVPRSYFVDLFKAYKDNILVSTVKVDEEVVTGTIHLKYRDSVYSWVGNPKPIKSLSPSPNDLLIWESIRYATENGYRYYTALSAAGNKRLHLYYAGKCNPALNIRYTATKKSIPADLVERGYLNILQPVLQKVRTMSHS
ncbi:MAG: GNAT family N-acetyltransferase [Methanoregula sp.]|uniref:GNAT family N-acetyltransferase n=2 Tax=Methanoregula sp. TaxID=2052170 RepID=UPI003C35ADA5